METPTTRRVTRSQTKQANLSRKMEESKQKSEKQERSVLIDITNDSPIVGLASGNLATTPISSLAKQSRNPCKWTPGSGEALLRCQVKTLLLHKVEEEEVEEEGDVAKFDIGSGNYVNGFDFDGVVVPTPANTPKLLNFSSDFDEFSSFTCVSHSSVQHLLTVSQVMKGKNHDVKKVTSEVGLEAEKEVIISRSLFSDFSEKSDSSSECSSVVTYPQGHVTTIETKTLEKSARTFEEDDASVWSIQVNTSTRDEDEEGDDTEVIDSDDDVTNNDTESELVELDELCYEMSKISVNGEKQGGKFMGKHIRFVYNSDDELVESENEDDSSGILRLKGLPTPKGKHLRFRDEGEDE